MRASGITRATAPDAPGERRPRRAPAAAIVALLAVALTLRVVYVLGYRIDTDEPQHLHVIWSWVRGRVQYRDVFDNHAPLFHLAYVPLAAALGERADLLLWMRAATIPLSALAVWSTYAIGTATFGGTLGAWAALIAALLPPQFLTSVEFRADTLWAALWLLALAVSLSSPLTPRRMFAAGLLLGATLATSFKTTLLLASLAVAAPVALARRRARPRTLVAPAAALTFGIAVVPLAVVAFLAARGALEPMLAVAVLHNVHAGMTFERYAPRNVLAVATAVPFACWAGWYAARTTADAALGARRALLTVTTLVYVVLLEGCWPITTRQDFLPWTPLATIVLAGCAAALGARVRVLRRAPPPALGVATALVEIVLLLVMAPPWVLRTRVDPALWGDVLRLTAPGDAIMDLKGETIFRDRPFYYALETLTRERMRHGFIADTIPERLRATGTCVAAADSVRFPARARAFLRENYLSVGRLRVAGRVLTAAGATAPRAVVFDVAIPASYALVSGGVPARGILDGHVYAGPEFLAAGRHLFRAAPAGAPIVLVWSRAVERGFVPAVAGAGA